ERPENGAAAEGKVERVAADEFGGDVFVIAAAELREGDGRVDVVEGDDAARGEQHPFADAHAFGDIGADEDGVGRADGGGVVALERDEVLMKGDAGVGALGGVAVGGIPRDVAFEKKELVSAGGEGAEEVAPGGGVAVAPGRGERQAEDDEFHVWSG